MTNRNRFLICILILSLLLIPFSGCQLAQPAAMADESVPGDLLVGVYLTREYLDLFDIEGYLADHPTGGEISAEASAAYQQRLYATFTDDADGESSYPHWDFPGVEGLAFFCAEYEAAHGHVSCMVNDGLADGSYHVTATDTGTENDIRATLYVPDGRITWYLNPVYQSADGSVYLTAGNGITADGGSFTHRLDSTVTRTDADGATQQLATHCEVTISTIPSPASATVYWLDAEAQVLRQEEYAADSVDNLPLSLSADGATCLLVALTDTAGEVQWSLCQPGGTSGNTVRFHAPGPLGTIAMVDCAVEWEA